MPNTLGRNLHLCFAKIKRPLSPQCSSSLPTPHHHSRSLLTMKNYNSLYDCNARDSEPQSPSSASSSPSSSSSSSSSASAEPDFATIFASQRFFFSSPGRSNSIIESAPSVATSTESSDTLGSINCDTAVPHSDTTDLTNDASNDHSTSGNNLCHNPHDHESPIQPWKSTTVEDSVAVPTYSPDPYMDFRRSMQEMVEARELVDVKANWDYLHELLLCYLALNPKSTHKFIVGAFADLLVSLLSASHAPKSGGGVDEESGFASSGCEMSRQCN